MTWTITYRGKDGQRDTLEIEATDRNAMFDELKRRGISAISVAEGKMLRKNRNRQQTQSSVRGIHSSRVLLAVIACVVLTASSVGVWYWLASGGTKPMEADPTINTRKAKSPIEVQRNTTVEPPATNEVYESEKPAGRLYKGVAVVSSSATTNGVDGAIVERLKLADGRTVKVVSLPKPLFESPSDQLIAMALSSQPGQAVAPMPIDGNVEQAFLDSLLSPIRINDDDPDNVKELKANVMEARAYIADEVKAGRSVREVLEEYQRQMNDIADRHLMAVQELQKIRKEYGVEEAREFAIRVNEAFRARSIPEINVPEAKQE